MGFVRLRAIFVVIAVLGANLPAAAATLGLEPTNDPLIAVAPDSVGGSYIEAFGFLTLAGEIGGQAVSGGSRVGPVLERFTITSAGLLFVLDVFEAGSTAPALRGDSLGASIEDAHPAFLFRNTGEGSSAMLNDLFSRNILVLLETTRSDTGGVVTFADGGGVITTPIPLPGAGILLLTSLATAVFGRRVLGGVKNG